MEKISFSPFLGWSKKKMLFCFLDTLKVTFQIGGDFSNFFSAPPNVGTYIQVSLPKHAQKIQYLLSLNWRDIYNLNIRI